MPSLDKFKGIMDRAPTDVVGLDFATSGVRAVRMKKTASGLTVTAAELLPPATLDAPADASPKADAALVVPSSAQGRCAALLTSDARAVLKLIRASEEVDLGKPEHVLSRIGIDPAQNYRVSTRVIHSATVKTDALVLAAAMPENLAKAMVDLLPKVGPLAPRFIGVSALAVLNAFHNDPRNAGNETAHGLIHFDNDYSLVALFNQGRLSQLRTFPLGMATFLQGTMEALGVDEETASGILSAGAFDVSQLVEQQTRQLRAQYVGCRDFMERSENCTLKKLHVSGPAALATAFLKGMEKEGIGEEWNALEGYPDRSPGSVPPALVSQPWLWSASIGACLGVLEPS